MNKILIAEDERSLANALELKLAKAGFETKRAIDGQEAIEMLLEEKFDLLLLDLIMPKIDGFGVLEQIKEKKIKIKIFVLTNLSQTQDEQKAKLLGAEEVFVKSNTPIIKIVEHISDTFNK